MSLNSKVFIFWSIIQAGYFEVVTISAMSSYESRKQSFVLIYFFHLLKENTCTFIDPGSLYFICYTGLTDFREFEKLASEILGICCLQNRYLSHQLLVRELSEFGNTTLFCLADENNLMDFMGQTCCQTKLNAIWKGHMALYTSSIKVARKALFVALFIHCI